WKLGAAQGRQCIVRPAELFGFSIDQPLANQLLEDLDDRGVDPSQLQILCSTLHRVVEDDATSDGRITLAHYELLGGASGILSSYLDQCLDAIPEGLRETAKAILKSLVTYDATKDARELDQLTNESLVRRTGARRTDVMAALQSLSERRLVRHV